MMLVISCTTNDDLISYYKNAKKKSVKKNINGELFMDSYWNRQGKLIVENGNGFDTIFYDDNREKPERIIKYVNGKEDGDWVSWDRDGLLIHKVSFKMGVAHGEFVTYNKLGELEECGYYIGGIKEGLWIDERVKSKRREGEYLSGKENGFWREYYDLVSYGEGTYENGLKSGKWLQYRNNRLKMEASYIVVEGNDDPVYGKYSSVEDGTWIYYSKGVITKKEDWVKGKLMREYLD